MGAFSLSLPRGWPRSLWFFVATAIVFLLQLFPYTGIFLMFAMAALWSVVLVNLGFIGVGLEALTGRVSRLWLVLPLLYFGGYYLVRASEQATLARMGAELTRENAGKAIPFDPSRRDLVIEKGKGDFHPAAFELVRRYGLTRAFEGPRVYLLGDSEACALVRSDNVYGSAGVYSSGFFGEAGGRKMVKGHCSIYAPAQPDRPVVRVRSDQTFEKRAFLRVQSNRFRIRDEASGQEVEVRAASAAPLKPFPMPGAGCALNSGAASWDCFAGFMRGRSVPLVTDGRADGGFTGIVAAALGLERSDDHASVASGVDAIRAFGRAADARLIDKEMAILESMLADPARHHKDSWLRHLPNRPEVIAPLAEPIVAALRSLQNAEIRGSETGHNLWRLAAALPEAALAPHRTEIVAWLLPDNARPWTQSSREIYARLDGSDPVEREILLHRLETRSGDLQANLLSSFCRMGAGAPDDAKRRLLALWANRAEVAAKRNGERPSDHVPLYFTLARMGLKEQAGPVEQRYYGPTFARIWTEVTPAFPGDLCTGSLNDISNRFRTR
jgi:hypothetical protein